MKHPQAQQFSGEQQYPFKFSMKNLEWFRIFCEVF